MRVIRIFLSTPSDVELERLQLHELVHEINDTVQLLVPERELRIEVVFHETHTYPNVSPEGPQDVVDHQLPADFDIYLGIMWRRCGTPTKDAASGTVHEFDQALERQGATGRPIVMFFFGDEHIPIPTTDDEFEQLRAVMTFRQRLSKIGYTMAFATRSTFRQTARVPLLRAIADVMDAPVESSPGPLVSPDAARLIRSLAASYDELRRTVPSGNDRTRRMQALFNEMVATSPSIRPMIEDLQASSSPGERLAGIAVLNAFPDPAQLDWLADRLDLRTETPFVGYQAAVALAQAARSLRTTHADALERALRRALVNEGGRSTDASRRQVLESTLGELARAKTVVGDR